MLDLNGFTDDETGLVFEEPLFNDEAFDDPLAIEGSTEPDPEEDEMWEDEWEDDDDGIFLTDDEFDAIVDWHQE